MRVSNIILSWDFLVSIILTLVTALILPTMLNMGFCEAFYNIGITVLSIIFSLFFASLAIVMTSSDNEFIDFLEENNDFTALLNTFKVTLFMLFLGLIYSIILFVSTNYFINIFGDKYQQHKIFFLLFEFLFSYSLLATALSVKDTIVFSILRAKYLKKRKENK